MYVQLAFAIDRINRLAPQHPEWRTTQPYQAALEGDLKKLGEFGTTAMVELIMATHAGMTAEEFHHTATTWLSEAEHPRFKRPYTQCVYQPMLELLTYMRSHGFKNYIVSGGGIDFMRPWAERVYGVPPEHVVGSTIKVKYEQRDGQPILLRMPERDFIDDGEGKPVGIHRFIGRRPIAAFGNSDGDLQMLQWTTAGPGKRLGVIVHHTDS